jgi:hypothetical protein
MISGILLKWRSKFHIRRSCGPRLPAAGKFALTLPVDMIWVIVMSAP